MKKIFLISLLLGSALTLNAQQVDYSVVSVDAEEGLNLVKISKDDDQVCMPEVRRNGKELEWWTGRVISISPSQELGFLAYKNNTSNVFVRNLDNGESARQRTNRQLVLDFSFSPDGSKICFSEQQGKMNRIFTTDAKTGFVCRQITENAQDYTPTYSPDMQQIFYARQEGVNLSIWGFNLNDNSVSSYTSGFNPYPMNDGKSILCTRKSASGRCEIWRVDYTTGVEECILSSPDSSFTTPSVSPDGEWMLLVGKSIIHTPNFSYPNTDIYVCKMDGTQLTQLTHHAANDVSPVWSLDGKYIYFVSQRGSAKATANIWRMNFNLK